MGRHAFFMVSQAIAVVEDLTCLRRCRTVPTSEHARDAHTSRGEPNMSIRMLGPIAMAIVTSLAAAGCQGVIWGNVAMLAISLGIFMGTLSLGRG